jgi:hypothetical protein
MGGMTNFCEEAKPLGGTDGGCMYRGGEKETSIANAPTLHW